MNREKLLNLLGLMLAIAVASFVGGAAGQWTGVQAGLWFGLLEGFVVGFLAALAVRSAWGRLARALV